MIVLTPKRFSSSGSRKDLRTTVTLHGTIS
jgi:hypothetical protein